MTQFIIIIDSYTNTQEMGERIFTQSHTTYPYRHKHTHTRTHTTDTLPSLRLTLALGTTEELPGCSCKVIKEALTAHWFRPPQSGLYWVTLEEGCGSGHQKRAVKVGQLTLVQLLRQHASTRWRGGSGGGASQNHYRWREESGDEPISPEVNVSHITQCT